MYHSWLFCLFGGKDLLPVLAFVSETEVFLWIYPFYYFSFKFHLFFGALTSSFITLYYIYNSISIARPFMSSFLSWEPCLLLLLVQNLYSSFKFPLMLIRFLPFLNSLLSWLLCMVLYSTRDDNIQHWSWHNNIITLCGVRVFVCGWYKRVV